MRSGLSKLVVLSTAVLAVAVPAGAAAAFQAEGPSPERTVLAKVWPDQRIVWDASCIEIKRARYACVLEVSSRPGSIPAAQWRKAAAAVRAGDTLKLRAALGILPTASDAEITDALHRWGLDQTKQTMVGLSRFGSGWRVIASPLTLTAFERVSDLKTSLRSAVPAIEAYRLDHGSYARATAAALREYDPGLPRNLVVLGTITNYCLALTEGGFTMSYRRGGSVVSGPCR
jgi:hypothetical protein